MRFYRTALHEAVRIGNCEIINLLLEQPNIKIDIKNEISILNQ